MRNIVRTGLYLCSLLVLPGVANAEPGVETAVLDTSLNANCSMTDNGSKPALHVGKSGEWLGDPACALGDGVTAGNRQRPQITFYIGDWIPSSVGDVIFNIYQEEALLANKSVSVATSSEGLIPGALWDDEPISDNPRATRGAAAHYYLHHPSDPAGSNNPDTDGMYPLTQGPTYASGSLFETDLVSSMENSVDGYITISLHSSFSSTIPDTDHYASLESPVGIPATLTFDGVRKECDVDADCDDEGVCNGLEACIGYLCVDGVNADLGTECEDTGECDGAGGCVSLEVDPLPDSYINLDVCGEPGSSTHTECLGINAFCPCALPGGYGGALQEYGWGHSFWGPWSFFNCGKTYVEGLEAAGTPMTEWLRLELRDAYWPGNSINNACWDVL